MAVKTVTQYALLSYTDKTSRINIYFSDGTEAAYVGLDAMRARLLLDILRNEKPVFWTEGAEILWTGREPMGEEEQPFNLDAWLDEHPQIRDAIRWESSTGIQAW